MIVAADLDGTTAAWHIGFAAYCATCGVTLPDATSWEFWAPALDRAGFDRHLHDFGEAGGYATLDPLIDAIDALALLTAAGHEIAVVTSRPATATVARSTLEWVAARFPFPVRAVLIGPDAKLDVEADLVVDDDPATVRLLLESGVASVLVDRPWNQAACGMPRARWCELPGLVEHLDVELAGVPAGERRWVLADLVEAIA